MSDFRLHLDDAEDPPRLLTGPEELTYCKNYEVACHVLPTDELKQLLVAEASTALVLQVQQQKLALRISVLRRKLSERK